MIETSGVAIPLALALAGASAPAPSPNAAAAADGRWILTCNMASAQEGPASPNARRVFRIGRGLFQEWKPAQGAFGRNLCLSYSCTRTPGRLEGAIQSPSLTLTVSLDLATRRASWRAVGASGLKVPSGPCSVEADTGRDGAPAPRRAVP